MSTTSKGYYIQSLTTGKFMVSTVVVNPPELPPVLPRLPQPDGDDYSPSYMPEGEEDDHLQDDVEEPMEIYPHGAAEQLHPPQGGAEVEVQVLDPKQKLVPTPQELQLADGSKPRRLRGKQHGSTTSKGFQAAVDHNRGECSGHGVFKHIFKFKHGNLFKDFQHPT